MAQTDSLSIFADTTVVPALLGRAPPDLIRIGVAFVGRPFVDVADIENRLRRQEAQRLEKAPLVAADAGGAAGRPSFSSPRLRSASASRSSASLSPPLAFFSICDDAPLEALEVGQHQFGLDRGDVGQGVDAPLHMRHVAILETAHHVGDRIALANIRDKLVAESFAFEVRARGRDVDEESWSQ